MKIPNALVMFAVILTLAAIACSPCTLGEGVCITTPTPTTSPPALATLFPTWTAETATATASPTIVCVGCAKRGQP